MAFTPAPGEQYTVRRKILTVFGASFHVYDATGAVVAFCRQKAFKLREDIRLYTSDSMSTELLTMKARSIIDFGATYDITLPSGELIGSLRRKGLASLARDQWRIFDESGAEIAKLTEDSTWLALGRRLLPAVALFSPQKLHITTLDGRDIATFRTHFNPFVYRLGVAIHAEDERLDDLLILAAACLLAAIEGRQESSG